MAIALNMKGTKTDPRCERPEAKDGGDWRYIGDVPDSVFSVVMWYKHVLQFHGRKRPDSDPFFVNALGDDRPLRYSVALKRFRALLDKVDGCDSSREGEQEQGRARVPKGTRGPGTEQERKGGWPIATS